MKRVIPRYAELIDRLSREHGKRFAETPVYT